MANVLHEIQHMPPVAAQLLWAYERALKPSGWKLISGRGGYNSYFMRKDGDPREWHFRWVRGSSRIAVFDGARMATKLGEIHTDGDVMRFVVVVTRTKKRWW